MNTELSEEAVEYGRTALRAFEAAGGDQIVQDAEREPARRADLVEPVLAELGAWDLDPRGGADELEAVAALCRVAGWWALPYPVAERLARPADGSTDGLVVIAGTGPGGAAGAAGAGDARDAGDAGDAGLVGYGPAAPVAGLGRRWSTVTFDGGRGVATAAPPTTTPRYGAFVTGLVDDPALVPSQASRDGDGLADLALGLVLPCWTLLGMLDRAIDLTRAHVLAREQFGQPLARFQGVQFQLTDAEVERLGVEELAKYALWAVATGRGEAVDDALALRLAILEAADQVFRVAHQLHGAMGFCDETTLSWISRYSQPVRRLPLGLSATRDELTRRIGRAGLAGPFAPRREPNLEVQPL
ncbi:acyl-CoA dehydrogenase [Parafrankia colletiae]|uniref:Acyl-CoA dehydrogenase n=1 Tax=Parafrankia colletiae TaxID=573497 RepID=A0A1S1QLY8_9ACTN|nr:acyl-CoA dehydrogenase family protein [Parafrankia colletiae]MCK9902361.1 acyl-CoA dehydrogenase [Frankia sp. Cpl3]OHV35753.1 acyl-CoA dehydrogenase [Parafrankia colletiae]